jgi:hypothetical protein
VANETPEQLIETVQKRANELMSKYLEITPLFIFTKGLREFLEFEKVKLNELRALYRERLHGIKYLN